jgi:maltose alpha-D-glucosyltransferase/alpha-amylase
MWDYYAPEPRMRLNLGIRRRLAPLMDNDQRKILLMHSLLLTMGGSPFLYYGDEIGMGDNIWLEDRNGVRTPMQWDASLNAGFSSAPPEKLYAPVISDDIYGYAQVNVAAQRADPNSLLNRIRHLLAIRKQHPVFGWGTFDWEDAGNNAIAAYRRTTDEESLLIINNLSDQTLNLSLPTDFLAAEDILTGKRLTERNFELNPYQFIWLRQTS